MFRMTVADVFHIRGRGLVATGAVEQGSLRVGDEVRINESLLVRVDGIEAFRKVVEQAQPGDNIGLLFKKLDNSDVSSGDVITGEGSTADYAPPGWSLG